MTIFFSDIIMTLNVVDCMNSVHDGSVSATMVMLAVADCKRSVHDDTVSDFLVTGCCGLQEFIP